MVIEKQLKCSRCKLQKYASEFRKRESYTRGYRYHCNTCAKEVRYNSREIKASKLLIYRRTLRGRISRSYTGMQQRVKTRELYKGLELIDRKTFIAWAEEREDLKVLHKEWVKSEYEYRLTPSIDRINPKKGYTLDNMRFLSQGENARLGDHSSSLNKATKATIKVSWENVCKIRKEFNNRTYPSNAEQLAIKYNCCATTIRRIANYKERLKEII